MLYSGRKIRNIRRMSFFSKTTSVFDENSTTVSGKNSKNFEVIEKDKITRRSTQFPMLIQNMIVLSHKSVVLVMKIEIHEQNS